MQELLIFLPTFFILLVIGAFAGLLAGLLGVGGGIVLVPAFYYAFSGLGYDNPQLMQICVATSLATIVFTSIRSVFSHNKSGFVDWKILQKWTPGIIFGAIIGVLVAAKVQSNTLTMIFGCLGIFIGLYMAFGRKSLYLNETMPTGVTRTLISSFIGFLSVLMGIGGGSFAVPLMTLHRISIHKAVATAAGFGLAIAIPSAVGFFIAQPPQLKLPPITIGYVNIPAFLVVVSMTMITAPIGADLAHKLNVKTLKRLFAFFLISIASSMLYTAFWVN